mmetsp:Transcript_37970/g.88768  ORF Transcript_37970/g.88768 Transcript_37970/m.88768 type:complete len:267 (+) Transcript_37970:232-1032(+)
MATSKLRDYHSKFGFPFSPEWERLSKSLPPFPLDRQTGQPVTFAEAIGPKGKLPPYRGNADYPIVYFSSIHPAGIVGLDSPPEELAIARDTVWAINDRNQWRPNNGLCLGWPSAGRVMGRENGTRVLQSMSDALNATLAPNFWPYLGGGGLEQAGGTEALHSMMLQSHGRCLRLFPGWPQGVEVAFHRLRAMGAFLVSARQDVDGSIPRFTITSEVGGMVTLCLPPGWSGVRVEEASGRAVSVQRVDDQALFSTHQGVQYTVSPTP